MKSRIFARKPLALALSFVFVNAPLWAQESAEPVNVDVSATRLNPDAVIEGRALDLKRAANPDTASLLTNIPGVNVNGVGALANIPVIRGMADDRLTIKVDGVDAISACSNHMNTPLSYVAPTSIQDIKVYKSITPVSVGGNSIGGAIVVNTSSPVFAEDRNLKLSGELAGFYYSNGDGNGANVSATAANEKISVNYTGSTSKANNYRAGGNFNNWGPTQGVGSVTGTKSIPNHQVGSSGYMTTNQAASLALKLLDNHTVQFQYSNQSTPFEGFANQRMDMTGNEQYRLNLRYWGRYNWGRLEAQAYKENINHTMNFGPNKQYWYGSAAAPVAGMPMNTNSNTLGAKIKGTIDLGELSVLRTGIEYQHYYLNDWWPPVANSPMMSGPLTFQNINGGVQQTASLYTEWEKHFDERLKTILGLRYDRVSSSTGNVNGYGYSMSGMTRTYPNTAYVADQNNFNSGSKSQSNNNVGLSAIANYKVDRNQEAEIGVARQVRNPNLYELYTWSSAAMAATMNNTAGDGNGYFGNPNLKPETAYTLSGSYDLHTEARDWRANFAPYYSYVVNYIDAVQWSGNSATGAPAYTLASGAYSVLRYVNQNAQLAGADLSGRMPLGKTQYGAFGLNGLLSYTWGRNQSTGYGLYNVMPLNAKLAFTQQTAGWDNALEFVAVARKSRTSIERNEIQTPGYFISNIRASYTWQKVRVDAGINNIFNTLYYNPLGGAYLGQGRTMTMNPTPAQGGPVWGVAMPMPGMSIYTALNVKF
jgi:iron complex outermembrane recepter protein